MAKTIMNVYIPEGSSIWIEMRVGFNIKFWYQRNRSKVPIHLLRETAKYVADMVESVEAAYVTPVNIGIKVRMDKAITVSTALTRVVSFATAKLNQLYYVRNIVGFTDKNVALYT